MTTPDTPRINGITVTYRATKSLKPHPNNPNTHSAKQVARIARSITDFGWTNPIIIDEDGVVLAGHGRLLAAEKLGLAEVPTICVNNMSAAQKRAYIIADNRMSEIGGTWDKKLLALEHEAIQLLDPEFDLTSTGFDEDDIEIMFDSLVGVDEDEVPEVDLRNPPVARVGGLWLLGNHKVYCGNSLEAESYEALLGGEKAQMVFTDPPYNVKIGGNCVGKGKHREFVMATGEMSRSEFTSFLTTVFGHLITFSEDGSLHLLFMDWRHMPEMIVATLSQYAEFKNLICWDKQSAGLGAFYRSQHELIWVMKNGTAKHINNFGLGQSGRDRSNVWSYQGLAGPAPDRKKLLALHPTVKPLPLVCDTLKDCSKKGGLILDCFGGSGTTLIAAEQTGRRAALIELDPRYVDVTIKRWQADTGMKALLAHTGQSFDELQQKGRRDDDQTAQAA